MENKLIKIKRWLRENGAVSRDKKTVVFNYSDLEDIIGQDILGRINERKAGSGCDHFYDEVPYNPGTVIFKCTKCGYIV